LDLLASIEASWSAPQAHRSWTQWTVEGKGAYVQLLLFAPPARAVPLPLQLEENVLSRLPLPSQLEVALQLEVELAGPAERP